MTEAPVPDRDGGFGVPLAPLDPRIRGQAPPMRVLWTAAIVVFPGLREVPMQPRVQVVLAPIEEIGADMIALPARRARDDGGPVVRIAAPRWRMPDGPDRLLADAYRSAVRAAGLHQARSMAVPGILARGPWPMDSVTRIALDVFDSNLTGLRQVWIAASTPAMLERWAEALVGHPRIRGHGHWR